MNQKTQDPQVLETPGKKLLEKAYLLETPDDNVNYYNELADSYDRDFADGLGYVLPQAVAKQYATLKTPSDSPAVDIGCGTGLLGKALKPGTITIDGMDISSEMLAHTRQKNIYRNLIEVDLTSDMSRFNNHYSAVLSSGTFTHGHLGPDSLVRLLDIAQPNALFVIAVNQTHYDTRGFDDALDSQIRAESIFALQTHTVGIYQQSGHEHSDDKGMIVSFRKV